VLLPAVISISRRLRTNPSRLLIPLAYASLLGGMMTLIGSPVNILASDALRMAGLKPFSLFDFFPVGVVVMVAGVVYMLLLGQRLLPDRDPVQRLTGNGEPDVDLVDFYRLGERLFRGRIPQGSPLIGKTLAESGLRQNFELAVIGIERRGETRLNLDKDSILRRGDVLLIEGMVDNLVWAEATGQLEVHPEVGIDDRDLRSEAITITEVILSPHSRMVGKTLTDVQFREKYRQSVLAILRDGRPRRTGLADLPLRFGDTLLVQGPRQNVRMLQREPDFVVLDAGESREIMRPGKAPLAVGLLLVMLVPVMAGWLPITAAALLAGVLMVITGCLTMDEAYQSIEWQAVFLVAGTLPLGIAMQNTGAAEFLAGLMVSAAGNLGPLGLLVGFYILTNLLTQFMSNAASTVLIAPIAIDAARQIGADPRSLLIAVAIAASAGFLTPVAHQSNILVMNPGGYRFGDYWKVGLPLDLLTLIVVVVFVPLVWPWP
jgi:di/tricarboxylate transporter